MAQEIIEAIRKAEIAAEVDEKEASKQAELIIAEAKEQAKADKTARIQAANAARQQADAAARAQVEQMMEAAKAEMEAEGERLRKAARARQQQAVQAILEELLEEGGVWIGSSAYEKNADLRLEKRPQRNPGMPAAPGGSGDQR